MCGLGGGVDLGGRGHGHCGYLLAGGRVVDREDTAALGRHEAPVYVVGHEAVMGFVLRDEHDGVFR